MKIRVLLADDHALMREGLRALLEGNGVEVIGEASTGREALQRAVGLAPDVVIMDISMPELNGVEAARLIAERAPGTRVIVLSMHSSTEHVWRAFEAGAGGYVLKEAAGAELMEALHAVHAGRRWLSPALRESFAQATQRGEAVSPLARLSARERQVLQLVVEGRSSAEIARAVHLSPKTVETYRSRIMGKLGVHDLPSLVKFALQQGLTPP